MEEHVLQGDGLLLLSNEWGDITPEGPGLGLYHKDTRYLSLFRMSVQGKRPERLASSSEQNFVSYFQLANPALELADGTPVMARTISIYRSRVLKGGLHERISFYNHNRFDVPLELSLRFGGDYLDIFEVRGWERARRGSLQNPELSDGRLTLSYMGLDRIRRRTEVIFEVAPTRMELEREEAYPPRERRIGAFLPEDLEAVHLTFPRAPVARVSWELTLPPRTPVTIELHIFAVEGGESPGLVSFEESRAAMQEAYAHWWRQCTQVETDNEFFNRLIQRSVLDLRLLMEMTPQGLVPLAGAPWFACVFGRDSIITSLQTLLLNPEIAMGTLRFLAQHQGSLVDYWRDEEPGKIVHEMRQGEMARLKEIPHAAYYGSVDATPLFLVLLTEAMRWLEDVALWEEVLPAAKLALLWMEHYGDLDGDGYLEYQTRSLGGIRDQGWKDSRGSVTFPDGSPVEPPVALVEVQGYAYQAQVGMAQHLRRFGERALAGKLEEQASRLRENLNRDFWVEEERFLAQALDLRKRQVTSVTSNPGHCLFSGILEEGRAREVVRRLTERDMFSGWGIRTLSSRSPKFNPMSYHNGSIWPHDNSIIVAGMRRYGYHKEALEAISQLFEASLFFRYGRLPELFCGFARDPLYHTVPAEYPVSCSPQAWTAGSPILLLQAMLGLRAEASAKRLYLDPELPPWLRSVSLRNLRLGDGSLDLLFERRDHEVSLEIARNEGGIEVVILHR